MLNVHQLMFKPMDNFIHILVDQTTHQAMVVDPAWNAVAIETFLNEKNLNLVGILLTHGHADHVNAVMELLSFQSVPVYFNHKDLHLTHNMLPKNLHWVNAGDSIAFANHEIKVIASPGHTAGGVCYFIDDALFVGDTLFINGCGRCNFPESDVNAMFHTLNRLKTLPDNTKIYCGHDYGCKKVDTLGEQKQTNPYLLIEDETFFSAFRMALQANYRSIPFQPSSAAEIAQIRSHHGY